jgi:DNA-binding transcriptional regulator YiaG
VKTADGLGTGIRLTIGAEGKTKSDSMTGKDVREWRLRRQLTQQDMADLLGMSRQAVQHWEYHDRDVPPTTEALLWLIDNIPRAWGEMMRLGKLRHNGSLSKVWRDVIREKQERAA